MSQNIEFSLDSKDCNHAAEISRSVKKHAKQLETGGLGTDFKRIITIFSFFFFFIKKINNIYVSAQKVACCSHQSDRLGYISRTNEIAASGCVSRTNRSVVFVLWFEKCLNFNKVKGDSERAVRKMESSSRMRNVGVSVFLTCILPRFMRNAILLNR